MMYRMADEDVKRSQSIAKWYEFDKDGNYNLRKDAPEDVIKIAADLEKSIIGIFVKAKCRQPRCTRTVVFYAHPGRMKPARLRRKKLLSAMMI